MSDLFFELSGSIFPALDFLVTCNELGRFSLTLETKHFLLRFLFISYLITFPMYAWVDIPRSYKPHILQIMFITSFSSLIIP